MFLQQNQNDERQLIYTRTGEEYQPARLYFEISNLKTVLGVFEKLRCVQFSHAYNCWRWLYDQEAKKIHFQTSYNKIPREFRPVVLADIFIRGNEMVMDMRSFQRAVQAVEFFYKRINPRAARITRLRVVNRLFDATVEDPETLYPPFDHFFEREDVYVPDIEALDQKLAEVIEQYEDLEERSAALMEHLESQTKKTLPEIEEIPIHVYEDKSTAGLNLALMFRYIEAVQHWMGNTSFTQYDAIELYSQFTGDDEDE